ncbi:polysaccharide deacetylase family protein [Marimonas sp. MJW-29]|uniref:Polysaccharide deacetylase family protein n=1 Tax=Sulfitobacter sediminis TaxID=3234186 RepID=A0ABV3RRM2_9RHOB
MADWSPLRRELALWRDEGRDLPLWWRDDDAVSVTPALQQLAALAERLDLPVHLAVVPKTAEPSLGDTCGAAAHLVPLVHGWAHRNHAPEGEKKAEFGYERTGLREDAAAGLARMRALFGDTLVEVFVPPWNRIAPGLIPDLAPMGYRGLSAFTPRKARFAAPGLVQINTHLDPIHWRGGGRLVAEETLIADLVALLRDRREGRTDAAEPLGLLTHHLVHDDDIWRFTERCLEELLEGDARPVDLRAEMP